MSMTFAAVTWVLLLFTYYFAGRLLHNKEELLKIIDKNEKMNNDMLKTISNQSKSLHINIVVQEILLFKLMKLFKFKEQVKVFQDKLFSYGIKNETLRSDDKLNLLLNDLIEGKITIEENGDGSIKKLVKNV